VWLRLLCAYPGAGDNRGPHAGVGGSPRRSPPGVTGLEHRPVVGKGVRVAGWYGLNVLLSDPRPAGRLGGGVLQRGVAECESLSR
jgi:hypothetical protein